MKSVEVATYGREKFLATFELFGCGGHHYVVGISKELIFQFEFRGSIFVDFEPLRFVEWSQSDRQSPTLGIDGRVRDGVVGRTQPWRRRRTNQYRVKRATGTRMTITRASGNTTPR
jgi:hypothetical protein